MANFFKKLNNVKIGDLHKSELTFLGAAILIFIVIVWYLFSEIGFLVDSFNKAFNVDVRPETQIRFQIDEAKKVLGE